MTWKPLTDLKQIEELIASSYDIPCLLFKHSTRCNISSIAKYRLEDDWHFDQSTLEPFYLDLLKFRNISTALAETFHVHHESPQVLLIKGGECIYDASHLDIRVSEIKEALE